MNPLSPRPSDRNEDTLLFIETILQFQDGILDAEGIAAFESEISSDPEKRQLFIQLQHQSGEIRELLRRDAFDAFDPGDNASRSSSSVRRHSVAKWGLPAAIAGIAAFAIPFLIISLPNRNEVPLKQVPVLVETSSPQRDVTLEEGARALFFQKAPIKAGSRLNFLEDYMLLEGLVKIAFPDGARAIIEAPALFRILDEKRLALDTGGCSVHAPDGAEGFQVVTPITDIVDRGTRFSVRVHDNSETEVQVIEGAADLYPSSDYQQRPLQEQSDVVPKIPESGLRLKDRESLRVGTLKNDSRGALAFDPDVYQAQLPDRLISYQASMGNGGVKQLKSVTVRRGGIIRTYPVEELIPIQLTWFQSDSVTDRSGHLAGSPERPASPQDWLEDQRLDTGVINPGGQPEITEGPPVMTPGEKGTPGLAFRFEQPVINEPGPDVVFFEIQCLPNLLDGDPFHILPLESRPGLKNHTVSTYDLTLNSPEALRVQPFCLHRYSEPVNSLQELNSAESLVNAGNLRLRFHALAVAVDLSSLGYQDGEEVPGLFIQHAAAKDASRVDLVYIAGLPGGRDAVAVAFPEVFSAAR